MKKSVLFFFALCLQLACSEASSTPPQTQPLNDSTRIAELDQYWGMLGQTVKEGDFEGYSALYHPDAVYVTAAGARKTSMPIAEVLQSWKPGFDDTRTAKANAQVEFRFNQRLGDASTAHESGIFHYTITGEKNYSVYVHFEGLLVKKDRSWQILMEYQISNATEQEWEAIAN